MVKYVRRQKMTFDMLKECVLDLREALKCVSQAEKCCGEDKRRQILELRLHMLIVLTDFYSEYLEEKAKLKEKDGGEGPERRTYVSGFGRGG